ncbi:MAG: hypothetical protein HY769_04630 [Candidatus Stahlbacteria bacterium]|nr:hypothetical protein [Candidatus Stahlbacteria bacterium]
MKELIKYLISIAFSIFIGCIDFFPPNVSIIKPQDGERVENHFVIEVQVKDNMNLDDKVEIYIDDNLVTTLSSPYIYDAWIGGKSCSFSLFAKAYDLGGNWKKSEEITLNYFSLTEMGSCDLPDIGKEIIIQGNYAYISYGSNSINSGLAVIDISNPANPVQAGRYIAPSSAQGLDISGDHVFIAFMNRLTIVNVSNPSTPYEVASYEPPASGAQIYDVVIEGNYAYVAGVDSYSEKGGFWVIDISNPWSPLEIGHCATDESPRPLISLIESGNYVYSICGFAQTGKMVIIDISVPSSPSVTKELVLPCYVNLIKSNHFLFFPNKDLYVYDVSDPLNPVEIASCNLPNTSAKGVAVSGEYAYISCYPFTEGKELWKVRVSNPTQMFISGYYNIAGENRLPVTNIAVSGKYAYVTTENRKLVIVKIIE